MTEVDLVGAILGETAFAAVHPVPVLGVSCCCSGTRREGAQSSLRVSGGCFPVAACVQPGVEGSVER